MIQMNLFSKTMRKRLPLSNVYYLSFMFFIVIPILIVLLVALLVLNQQFKTQAVENIKRAQETVITELKSDIDIMSMRLSHLIYTNNNEMLAYAAETDTEDGNRRYEYEQKLQQTGNLALEPVKDIVSVGFYMKNGKSTYIKNDINRSIPEIQETKWYQEALSKVNTVTLGSYDILSINDLYKGGKKDMLILVYALAPDVTTDRSQKIEMVAFYQATDAADRIKGYNRDYFSGNNKLGITQISNDAGEIVFSTTEEMDLDFTRAAYTCVSTPIELNGTTWYIESYIKTGELTSEYWDNAILILCAAVLILVLAGHFSRYFLRSIVKPVEEISRGLRQVEEGNLEVHIAASGQFEVRNMIHQFNAMVRRLKVLIDEYEEKVKSIKVKPEDYLASMLKGELTPEEVEQRTSDFFKEQYAILGFHIENYKTKESEVENATKIVVSFERNPRFASRCTTFIESPSLFFVYYRINEEDYVQKAAKMAEELQRSASREFGVDVTVCIGEADIGSANFMHNVREIRAKMPFRHLGGVNTLIDLNSHKEEREEILRLSENYIKLANALYIADEKNVVQEKEMLLNSFNEGILDEMKIRGCAVILAIGNRFSGDGESFSDIFGQSYNYLNKIGRIEESRGLKLWFSNYFAWIMEYSASRLNATETDVIIKAKHFMTAHYEDAGLSLTRVAEYVGLNEKYFTNRFTKETGETFSAYLTELRMQKAKELLKTTTFKIYEIAEMVGYNNVEHFNRMFKKLNGVSPVQFRKNT